MLKKDVKIGCYYAIRHHDNGPKTLSVIKIDGEHNLGGWNATKLKTGNVIRIRSAQKLRGEVGLNPRWEHDNTVYPKWVKIEDREKMLKGIPVFFKGRRYRVEILPAGARTRTILFDANYLGLDHAEPDKVLLFDCRPEAGTQQIRIEGIRNYEDIGKAVYAR
jgi:hypothetical protein